MPPVVARLDWSETAARELLAALEYIAQDSLQGARLVKGRIDRASEFLRGNPLMGTPGAVAGTREYPVPRTRYTLIYETRGQILYITHCWHQSRKSL